LLLIATNPKTPMNSLAIEHRLLTQRFSHGEGFRAIGVRGDSDVLDPFLMVDHYWMSQPTFGAHPHAGFSAVTYMFEDAQTGFRNRDSRGDDSIIRPGDLHWTTAGAGIVHDEVPLEPGRTAHGLQLFVNLPAARKHMAPGAIHIPSERMPTLTQPTGAKVRVVFGGYDDGLRSIAPVVDLPTDAALFDIAIDPGKAFRYPVPIGHTAFVHVIAGQPRIGETDLAEGQGAALSRSGGEVVISSAQRSQVVLFLGRPLREPVVRHGPFAMTNAEDLARAVADYQAGRMGHL
jgi:redox-sensitive bicupin YhaK (pirin superfamily)